MTRRYLIAAVALMTASGSFAQDVPLYTVPTWSTSELGIYSTGMIWRDCDNNGFIDAFFSNGNDMALARNNIYLFGLGFVPTTASWYSSNADYSGHCAVGDINDDGFPDFVVANYLGPGRFGDPGYSDLYINQGGLPEATASWRTPEEFYAFSCALGDLDGDGDLDLAFATGEGYQGVMTPDIVYRNDNGVFSSQPVWSSVPATAALDVTWGDVDHDGDLDLALTYESHPTAVYYNSGGVLETSPSWQAATSESGNTLVFGDINMDGWLDLVVAYNNQLGGGGYFRVYFNDGTGALSQTHGWQSATGGYGSALALCDYDNDGDNDLAAGRWFNELWVYENDAGVLSTTPAWYSDNDMVAEELAWVDIDGSGVLDMVDTFYTGTKLCYTAHQPLYAVDSVVADGALLGYADFCYDLVSGWVSLAQAPSDRAQVYYRYSLHNDLAVSNWDQENFVFGNTHAPLVDISASTDIGPAPLAVQFTDNSADATAWSWSFGDGGVSYDQDPLYSYEDPGLYDVAIDVSIPGHVVHRSFPYMIAVHADTIWMTHARLTGGEARVDIYLHNYLPLSELTIPFGWNGAMDLDYDSLSVSGMRAEYFDDTSLVSIVPSWKAASLRLAAGTQEPLPPGSGPIASLYFSDAGSSADSSDIYFSDYTGQSLELVTMVGSYVPEAIDGSVSSRCCVGRVGDANDSGDEEPTIGDITAIIDMLFITEKQVACMAEADVNQSGGYNPTAGSITIGDISMLIDYLFIHPHAFDLPECL